ncbi:MAG: class I SAM-dependent methyltransferase, partial [Candidatus Binatota bacterium]
MATPSIMPNWRAVLTTPFATPCRCMGTEPIMALLLAELKRFLPQSRLWGLDISLAMARKTRAKIEYVLAADAASLPFKGKAFDLVLS